jgi:hypothetical protein
VATVKEELCFVQFMHPGGEHGFDAPGLKHWNRGDHRRKFMLTRGQRLDEAGEIHEGDLAFWGEWEPPSRAAAIPNAVPFGPRFIHEPFLPSQPPPGWRQNTDPFVFGKHFHYTGCLQRTKFGPTQLMYLARGSVILFGSRIGGSAFGLDTVFVADRHLDHSRRNLDEVREQVSATYIAATLEPWYSGDSTDDGAHRLYFGATFHDPVEGMFSFFPALPAQNASQGFARATINLPDAITPTMSQGKRLNKQLDVASVHQLWERVVAQVRDQGLNLGIFTEPPPVEHGSTDDSRSTRHRC